MGIFNADIIINIPPAFFSLQKSGLVRVYLTSVFLLLSVPRCFGDQKPQFDWENKTGKRMELIQAEDRDNKKKEKIIGQDVWGNRPQMILGSLVGQTLEHTQQTKHNYLKLSVYQSRQEKNSELFIDTSVP